MPLATPVPREAASSRFAAAGHWGGFGTTSGVEVSEARHDPELDAAVIAFANADFAACEQALQSLITAGEGRNDQPPTWLVLFDFYRAIGQQVAFENLAAEFSARFGTPAPRWRSIPQAIADVQRGGMPRIHWPVPAVLDVSTLAQLPARSTQWPQPWIIDWSGLERIEPAAEPALAALFGQWSSRRIDMRWLGGEHLLALLAAAAPPGATGGSRACWDARLAVMRMLHQPAGFDDVAIDYASTYRCAAPAWERSLCRVRLIDSLSAPANPDSTIAEATTAFVETTLLQQEGQGAVAEVELSGELVGDIGPLLQRIDAQVEGAQTIVVSCHRLVRVDFLASGDLLNWVIAKERDQRQLSFVAAQRLVALFFAAMGIDEYARVTVDEG